MSARASIPIIIVLLVAGSSLSGLAETETVIINAQIGAQLVLNVVSGDCVVLSVDPLNAPSANGGTIFEVKTNAITQHIMGTMKAISEQRSHQGGREHETDKEE